MYAVWTVTGEDICWQYMTRYVIIVPGKPGITKTVPELLCEQEGRWCIMLRRSILSECFWKEGDMLELILDIVYIINFIGALTSIIMFIESRVERFYDKRKKWPVCCEQMWSLDGWGCNLSYLVCFSTWHRLSGFPRFYYSTFPPYCQEKYAPFPSGLTLKQEIGHRKTAGSDVCCLNRYGGNASDTLQ